mmetsp:Transcript_5783/g.35917  ORF Transcript_5783/g.35917 Transcript_5783/m.35917 type:complete len:358 (+) Transcript_5783:971-2044(+)
MGLEQANPINNARKSLPLYILQYETVGLLARNVCMATRGHAKCNDLSSADAVRSSRGELLPEQGSSSSSNAHHRSFHFPRVVSRFAIHLPGWFVHQSHVHVQLFFPKEHGQFLARREQQASASHPAMGFGDGKVAHVRVFFRRLQLIRRARGRFERDFGGADDSFASTVAFHVHGHEAHHAWRCSSLVLDVVSHLLQQIRTVARAHLFCEHVREQRSHRVGFFVADLAHFHVAAAQTTAVALQQLLPVHERLATQLEASTRANRRRAPHLRWRRAPHRRTDVRVWRAADGRGDGRGAVVDARRRDDDDDGGILGAPGRRTCGKWLRIVHHRRRGDGVARRPSAWKGRGRHWCDVGLG